MLCTVLEIAEADAHKLQPKGLVGVPVFFWRDGTQAIYFWPHPRGRIKSVEIEMDTPPVSPNIERLSEVTRAALGIPSPRSPPLEQLVREALARFDVLTPEQQAEHRRAQRKSWARSEFLLEHPDQTEADFEHIWQKVAQ